MDEGDLTPLPRLGPVVSPQAADYELLRSQYEQQSLQVATLQAICDELRAEIRRLRGENYVLASTVKHMTKEKK